MPTTKLAIDGGEPLRKSPLPSRKLFAEDELQIVKKVFEDSWENGVDFGYQGKYEKNYTRAFCEFQGGGFADAVSSGTASLLVVLSTLNIPEGSEIIFSPVTDPGGIAPALFLKHKPVVADSEPDSFNIGPNEFEAAITPETNAVIVTHVGGIPVEIDRIIEIAAARKILVIEDCSQAHGALYNGIRVGRFGDMAIFSTMFSKNHATGGCGGVVFTKSQELYRLARSHADRGKAFYDPNFDPKNPGRLLFGALNLNQDELSCAIGLSTLNKLEKTIERRLKIIEKINKGLSSSKVVHPVQIPDHLVPSPFFLTVNIDIEKLTVSKEIFAKAVAAEGIWVNPDYKYVVSEWPWINDYFPRKMYTPNATSFRETSFNILFNERFDDHDVEDIIACILKVEKILSR